MSSLMDTVAPLFSPGRIGALTLRNRFVLPGMQRGLGIDAGPSQRMVDHYKRVAAGGCGLIISESCAVDHPSASRQKYAVHMTPATLEGWRRCAAAVREGGASFFIQLWHEGAHRREGATGPFSEGPTISPSGLVAPGKGHGRPATLAQLREVRDAFIHSALMAQDIGASGIEVHGAHGYLIDQSLWAKTNIRADEYGGPHLEDRMRLGLEIVRGIRAACGPQFAIGLRFSQWKEIDFNARVFETRLELQRFLTEFRRAGVDVFSVSTRRFYDAEWPDSPLSLAGWVKSMTDAAVIASGSVGVDKEFMLTLFGEETESKLDASLTELGRRFSNHEFDFIAVGRSQLGDSEWVQKVRTGRLNEVRHFRRKDIVGEMVWEADFVAEAHGKEDGSL